MKSFKKKVLASAVLASVAGAAQAVYVDPNGMGQMLIYPYYTVQGGHNTYVSVVNTTSVTKLIKVRFREGKASRDVLDFNLYLSPYDVWTGAVIPSPTTAGARLITADKSCTNPEIKAGGEEFRNYDYLTAANTSAAGTGLDRTREGYIEMIEMATFDDSGDSAPYYAASIHDSSGVPFDCAFLRPGKNNAAATAAINAAIDAPSGGLHGTVTLINVATGQDSGYNAVALAAFQDDPAYYSPDNILPDVSSADTNSVVVSGSTVYNATWASGTDAVSSVLMHSQVINEYVLDSDTKSQTDWVMTFPTKSNYVTTSAATTPFTNKFTSSGACEPILFQFWDREERTVIPTGDDFSPAPPGAAGAALCWESTVLSIRNGAAHMPASSASGVLASVNSNQVTVLPSFQNGWGIVEFGNGAAQVSDNANSVKTGLRAASGLVYPIAAPGQSVSATPTFYGLPVVGFMVRTFNNGTLGNFQANYGSAFGHKYAQDIIGGP